MTDAVGLASVILAVGSLVAALGFWIRGVASGNNEQIKALNVALDKANERADRANQRIDALRVEQEIKLKTVADNLHEIEKLFYKQTGSNEQLRDEITRLLTSNATLIIQVGEGKQQIADLLADNNHLRDDIRNYRIEIADLKVRIETLERLKATLLAPPETEPLAERSLVESSGESVSAPPVVES